MDSYCFIMWILLCTVLPQRDVARRNVSFGVAYTGSRVGCVWYPMECQTARIHVRPIAEHGILLVMYLRHVVGGSW